MSIRILRSLIVAALLSASLAQAAIKVGNVKFTPQQTVQQRTLELNNANLRTQLGFKVYTINLYLHTPLTKTLPVGLYNLASDINVPWGQFAAGAMMVSIPVLILFLYLQTYLESGLTVGGVKG